MRVCGCVGVGECVGVGACVGLVRVWCMCAYVGVCVCVRVLLRVWEYVSACVGACA